MILVTGATGTNGREIVRQLTGSGAKVRILARDAAKAAGLKGPNVELAEGDFGQPETLMRALAGIESAFLLSAVSPDQVELNGNFIRSAKQAGTQRIVRMSAACADPGSPSLILRMHAESDAELSASGIPHTILRPASFFQNMFMAAESIKNQGAFYLPMKNTKHALVDVRDIARVAVKTLTETGHEGSVYDITGPEALSYGEVAERFSEILKRKITYVDVPPEAARAGMIGMGVPEWHAGVYAEVYSCFAEHPFEEVSPVVGKVCGTPPASLTDFLKENAAAFA